MLEISMLKLNIIFNWKSMGINAYLPLLTSLLLLIVIVLNNGDIVLSMPVIEMVFPIFGCWWSIFILHDLLSENGNEVLFSLPMKRWKLGVVPVLIFFLLYMCLMIVMLALMSNWIGLMAVISLGLQLSVQSFFYAGLGFLSMVITRSTGWSIIAATSYLSLMLLTTQTSSLQIIDIYLHNVRPIPVSELIYFIQKVGVLGILMFINAQYLLSTTTRFKT
ncbi:hypothetical protein ACFW1P_16470 [Paenibacillus sp. NPDC058910]|uniref:hypothetical protein n=1 Tax=Paenibacillus sp. NPDC058910 TaxID=3346670 RepID=UPI0036BE9E01